MVIAAVVHNAFEDGLVMNKGLHVWDLVLMMIICQKNLNIISLASFFLSCGSSMYLTAI